MNEVFVVYPTVHYTVPLAFLFVALKIIVEVCGYMIKIMWFYITLNIIRNELLLKQVRWNILYTQLRTWILGLWCLGSNPDFQGLLYGLGHIT